MRIAEFLELLSLTECLRKERYIYNIQFGPAKGLNVMCKEFDNIENINNVIYLNSLDYYINLSDMGTIYDAENKAVFKGHFFSKNESSIYDLMESNLTAPFSPTEELKQFVKQGFKDSAQIKHEQTLYYSKIAIGIAIFFSMVSLFVNLVSAQCGAPC